MIHDAARVAAEGTPPTAPALSLFTTDPRSAEQLRERTGAASSVLVASDWERLEALAPASSCSVVHIEWLPTSPAFPLLIRYKERNPGHPVVLVTRWDPENARHLKDVRVEEVIWWREVRESLARAVARVCRHRYSYVRCLAVPLENAPALPPTLRAALAHACRSTVPVRSVESLAAAVGCDRRTLWLQWRRAPMGAGPVRLQDFLHWVLLLRAVGRKTPGESWAAVAKDIGIDPKTLARFARGLAGTTLTELARDEGREVMRRFRERVVGAILGEAPLDILGADGTF